MCGVDVQRRFGDIDWEASLDILVRSEQYPGGPLPGNFTETASKMSQNSNSILTRARCSRNFSPVFESMTLLDNTDSGHATHAPMF